MDPVLTPEELEALCNIPTPAISNAIEAFNVRPHNVGFAGPSLRPVLAGARPIAGYAATVLARAGVRPDPGKKVSLRGYYEHILAVPAPRIAVVQDFDDPPVGAFWGEVQSNVHKALGCVGTVTHGGVRDLDEVAALGFQLFCTHVMVSHAYVHMVDYGIPVRVAGLEVRPGDLLVADKHGVINVPLEIAREIPARVKKDEAAERVVIEYCRGGGVTPEELAARFARMQELRKQ
ncbi:MAG: RraA family protein [Firmicutes bacterium]|nr:RraA family protein [Bacillota bacterium]